MDEKLNGKGKEVRVRFGWAKRVKAKAEAKVRVRVRVKAKVRGPKETDCNVGEANENGIGIGIGNGNENENEREKANEKANTREQKRRNEREKCISLHPSECNVDDTNESNLRPNPSKEKRMRASTIIGLVLVTLVACFCSFVRSTGTIGRPKTRTQTSALVWSSQWLNRVRRARELAALDLAVVQLRTLESLDEQLESFVTSNSDPTPSRNGPNYAAAQARPRLHRTRHRKNSQNLSQIESNEQTVCALNPFKAVDERTQIGRPPDCLAQATNYGQVSADGVCDERLPTFMLNLYKRLKGAQSIEEAVRLMPYSSLVMRSFRQPPQQSKGKFWSE